MLHKFAKFVSSSKGSKAVIVIWIAAILILSLVAPGSSDVEGNTNDGSAHQDRPSTEAQKVMDKYFPSDDGPVALLVYHKEDKINDEEREDIKTMSKWLDSDDKPGHVASALPFHDLPEKVQEQLFSDDGTTMQMNVALDKDLESGQMHETIEEINHHADEINHGNMEMKITGPAGISADTVSMFKNADFVLMFATIGLILVLLMIIYRSPLLAVIPLVVAGMVYAVTDRIIGIGGDSEWFVVDGQATSIMMILLFAVLTDYSLFVLSRYRSELRTNDSKYEAMAAAFEPILKPILFSGATLLAAMLVLFLTDFQPYNHFAPVFSIAIVFILLGGITLIPAIFTLAGRKAFWPFIPKVEDADAQAKDTTKVGFWTKVGKLVTRKPGIIGGVLLILLLLASVNIGSMKFSFNQLESFPEDVQSREGFELLADNFPPGKLAPVDVILTTDDEIEVNEDFAESINNIEDSIMNVGGIEEVTPKIEDNMVGDDENLPRGFLAETNEAVKLQITLKDNPYDQSSLDVIEKLRDQENSLLKDNGLNPDDYNLHYAGQTAEQLDVRDMNQRDMIVAFSLIAVLITIMLMFQSGSIIMGLIMMLTMLLSYTASLGLGWLVFHHVLGYDAISYRLPLYVFVFLISLGVDYNIILVSRIREEIHHYKWKEAISRGLSLTGGVISSAGIILAGTFTVLMTQPLQELFLFGLTMGMGILIDTFLVRGVLLPSILTFIRPKQVKDLQINRTQDFN